MSEAAPSPQERPRLSAVICTRNRGDSILRTLRSVLACEHPSFDVVVIDQSTDGRTCAAVDAFRGDARLRYVPSDTMGLGRARNLGLAEARAPIAAMTDDDCEVPPDWLARVEAGFDERPRAVLLYGTVLPGDGDLTKGFIPAFTSRRECVLTGVRDWCRAHGIGANMAARCEPLLAMGGFDECLGAGGLFPSYEDSDVAIRALLLRHEVIETPAVHLIHHGFRSWEQGRDLGRRDWLAIGATHAKLLRCGRWSALRVARFELWAYVIAPLFRELARFRKPPVLNRGICYARGFVQGIRVPVDATNLVFAPANPAGEGRSGA